MKLAAKFSLTLRRLVHSVLLLHELEAFGNRTKVSLFSKLLEYCTGTLNKYSLYLKEFMTHILVLCAVLIFQDTDLVLFYIICMCPHEFFVESKLEDVMHNMNYCPLSSCFHYGFNKIQIQSLHFYSYKMIALFNEQLPATPLLLLFFPFCKNP